MIDGIEQGAQDYVYADILYITSVDPQMLHRCIGA